MQNDPYELANWIFDNYTADQMEDLFEYMSAKMHGRASLLLKQGRGRESMYVNTAANELHSAANELNDAINVAKESDLEDV